MEMYRVVPQTKKGNSLESRLGGLCRIVTAFTVTEHSVHAYFSEKHVL